MKVSRSKRNLAENSPEFLTLARSLLAYDAETGAFTWLRNWYCCKAHEAAGNVNHHGYRVIGLFGKDRYAHRLAWLFHTGKMPKHTIDHINGSRADNRISNLRDVPISINVQNAVVARLTNRTGMLGVTHRPELGKWQAGIVRDGKYNYLGMHESPEEASAAYREAKKLIHPECPR